jgi:DNA polymerase sigma
LKIVDPILKCNIDIVINETIGIFTAKNTLRKVTEYPALKPVFYYLKKLIEANNMWGFSKAGLGSVALQYMLLHLIKRAIYLGDDELYKGLTVRPDALLANFLMFYGLNFNNKDLGLLMASGLPCFIIKDSGFKENELVIIDPLRRNLNANISSSTRAFADFQKLFRNSSVFRRIPKTKGWIYPKDLILNEEESFFASEVDVSDILQMKKHYEKVYREYSMLKTELYEKSKLYPKAGVIYA